MSKVNKKSVFIPRAVHSERSNINILFRNKAIEELKDITPYETNKDIDISLTPSNFSTIKQINSQAPNEDETKQIETVKNFEEIEKAQKMNVSRFSKKGRKRIIGKMTYKDFQDIMKVTINEINTICSKSNTQRSDARNISLIRV